MGSPRSPMSFLFLFSFVGILLYSKQVYHLKKSIGYRVNRISIRPGLRKGFVSPMCNFRRGRVLGKDVKCEGNTRCQATEVKAGHNHQKISVGQNTSFSDLGIPPYLVHRLEDISIFQPTRIQAASIPLGLQRDLKPDLILEERTGQGKTLAYLLPLVSEIDNMQQGYLQGIVLVPSTTLARQVMRVLLHLTKGGKRRRKDYPIISNLIVDHPDQSYLAEFEGNPPHVLVGIPSVVEAVLRESYGVDLSQLKHIVFDEVDKMISIERERLAIEKLLQIRSNSLEATQPHTVFVSASMTEDSLNLAGKHMKNIKKISLVSGVTDAKISVNSGKNRRASNLSSSKLPSRIRNYYISLPERASIRTKGDELARLYKALSHAKFEGSRRRNSRPGLLVFVRNPAHIAPLLDQLRGQYHMQVRGIDSKSTKTQLKQARELLASGRLQILIGTELMARGMDIEGVTDVVNLDVPRSSNAYLHRAGRAGRLKGKLASSSSVFTYISDTQISDIEKISRNLGVNITKAYVSRSQRLMRDSD
mmetsp:Transcript_22831/g.34052  ORF Transcript_22831/g.34052 Transcript_22831/m.34052 type:complete len:533 (+) Transcript_22831:1-1599(+)